MSENKRLTINYKAVWRVFNNQIKKGLLLSLSVNFFFKIGEYFGKVTSKTWLSRALASFLAVCWPGAQSA